MKVQTFTPPDVVKPIGPYSHIAKAGGMIAISGTAGVDAASGDMAADVAGQTRQIIRSFRTMLDSVDSSLEQVMHVHIFMLDVGRFDEMNLAYAEEFGAHRPARTVIGVAALPKKGALLTMNLTAVAR